MKLLEWLTETFIATFGITHPRPEQQRMAVEAEYRALSGEQERAA